MGNNLFEFAINYDIYIALFLRYSQKKVILIYALYKLYCRSYFVVLCAHYSLK